MRAKKKKRKQKQLLQSVPLAPYGEVGVERIECGDTGWIDNKGSETTIEGYSMAESKSSLEGEGKGEFKVRSDWETYG